MKKLLYAVLILIIIGAAFWAGSGHKERETAKSNPSSVKPATNVDAVTDNQIDLSSLSPGSVKISPGRQQAIGLRVNAVEKKPVVHTLRILGRVEADETRIYRINASVDGWILEAYPNSVGSWVKKGEVLGTFSNPQFLDAEQGYLFAIGTVERLELGKRRQELGRKEGPAPAAIDQYTLQRQMDILRGMGVTDAQIEEIGRTRKITLDIRITAPADGFISARNISPGERFLKGKELYRIDDLSRVWILADVYDNEAQYFKPGTPAKVSLPYQDKTYQATVSKVLPVFDPNTRTLKVRFEADNPGFVMRPGMFADVELPIKLPPAITIPADAILDSGLKKTVFVDRGNGFFEPRVVETGWRMGNRVEIVRGLEVGEKIVTSGTFLVDSESKLELAAQGMYTTLSKDPVCGIDVAMRKAEKADFKSSYKGKTYYFDSDECKQKFEREPGRYVKQ